MGHPKISIKENNQTSNYQMRNAMKSPKIRK